MNDTWGLTHNLCDLSYYIWMEGKPALARRMLEESLNNFRLVGSPRGVSWALQLLAEMVTWGGNYPKANALLDEVRYLAQERGDKLYWANASNALGLLACLQGDMTSAQHLWENALQISLKENYRYLPGMMTLSLAYIACYQGELEQAIKLCAKGLAENLSENIIEENPFCFLAEGDIARKQNDAPGACANYQRYLSVLHKLGRWHVVPLFLEGLAKAHVQQNQLETAACLFGIAQALRQKIGVPISPLERNEHEGHLSTIRKLLEKTAFSEAWEKGLQMPDEHAIEYALSLP